MNYDTPVKIADTVLTELAHFGANFHPAGSTAVIGYNEHLLRGEPFIGYVELETAGEIETYLICRNQTPLEFRPADESIVFASYLAPIGGIVAQRVGQSTKAGRRMVKLRSKARFLPVRTGNVWDAQSNRISWGRSEIPADSLSALLESLRAESKLQRDTATGIPTEEPLIPFSLELTSRRSVVQVTQLPDQAILDEIQDPIFRHSISGAILITGAPGTGKTTVQIKRLAQKTKWEFLTAEEKNGLDQSNWTDNHNWIFFTPTTLLKSYLKEALAKEQLAASDANVKVWQDYQVELLRRIRFLRVKDTDDNFRRAADQASFLRDTSSLSASKLAETFYEWMNTEIDRFVRETLALPEDFRLPIEVIADRREKLSKEAKTKLGYAPLFRKIPALYDKFRKDSALRAEFYREGELLEKGIKEMRIDQQEMSMLLYVSLRWVRATWNYFDSDDEKNRTVTGGPSYLIQDQKLIVAIDEASDFSAVELAAMSLLADPIKSSISLSGDLMQRLTSTGLRSWAELEALGIEAPRFELRRAYRQTDRLTRLAGKLYSTFSGDSQAPSESINPADNDPVVLVKKTPDAEQTASWVAQRIKEIFDLSGGRLPSIGVLLPSESDVAPFTKLLKDELFDSAIDVEASLSGQSLGTTSKVRVFCVDHIKGLEFESVFFCDIDVMAEKQGDLIDKFVYVGLSRARSFLGMTFRNAFPEKLNSIKNDLDFSERFAPEPKLQPWRSYLEEDQVEQLEESARALLDKHFSFYWDMAHGEAPAETPAQRDFVRFAQSVVARKNPTPANEHQSAFGAFLEMRTLGDAE